MELELTEPLPDELVPATEFEAAEPSPLEERLDRLESLLSEHLREMSGLSRDAFRHAHEELGRTREGAALGALRPLVNELLLVHDDLGRLIAHYAAAATADPREVVDNLEGLRTQLDETLARRGIVPLRPLATRFDRDTQRAVRVVPVANAAEDLTVLDEVRIGFHGPGGVVRRADVTITRFQPVTQPLEPA